VTGYASLFDDPYDVFGGPIGKGWTETVDRGAFKTTLSRNPDVVFVLNHDKTGIPLARTTAGTLRLSVDSKGLLTEARIDRRDPLAQSVEIALEKRHMQEMSSPSGRCASRGTPTTPSAACSRSTWTRAT
jgi:HK97 family phage prohead protease